MTDRSDIATANAVGMDPISVRISAAVRLTGISRSRIYELIQAGDIETTKIGRSTFILYRSLKRLLEGDDDPATIVMARRRETDFDSLS